MIPVKNPWCLGNSSLIWLSSPYDFISFDSSSYIYFYFSSPVFIFSSSLTSVLSHLISLVLRISLSFSFNLFCNSSFYFCIRVNWILNYVNVLSCYFSLVKMDLSVGLVFYWVFREFISFWYSFWRLKFIYFNFKKLRVNSSLRSLRSLFNSIFSFINCSLLFSISIVLESVI